MEVTVDALESALSEGKVSDKDRVFALSLVSQARQRGTLSEKQMYWVGVLVNRAFGKVSTAVVGDFAPVYALFRKAGEHLKYPKVTLVTDDGQPLQLYVSGERSRVPGVVNVRDGAKVQYPARAEWYGRIGQDGVWTQNDRLPEEAKPRLKLIAKLLKQFAKNPEKVASEYGKLTGNCCFCSRTLEDERSTDVGYGPVCAKRYGLQWGKA